MNPPRKNFLNWTADEDWKLDAPVYRFMSFRRLEKLCASKKNCVVRPKIPIWDDPFENFFFSAPALDANGRPIRLGFSEDFYCQCWTDADELDAMWRIYCRDKNGVRVQCTPRKLLTGLYSSILTGHDKPDERYSSICCFIGKVSYHAEEQLRDLLKDETVVRSVVWNGDGAAQCGTLLLKRTPFSPESEVRLLYQLPKTDKTAGDWFLYPLDPLSIFDEVVLDPRLKEFQAKLNTTRLRGLGFDCSIRQSTLYQLP